MITRLIRRLAARVGGQGRTADLELARQRDFESLNRVAPLAHVAPADDEAAAEAARAAGSVICREPVLDRDGRVAAYEFRLKPATRERVRGRGARIRHLYDEVVVRNLLQFGVAPLLGHRLALVAVAHGFLDSPLLAELPAANCVPTLSFGAGEEDDPDAAEARVAALKRAGYRVALQEAAGHPVFERLLPAADLVLFSIAGHTPAHFKRMVGAVREVAPGAVLMAKDLQLSDELDLCRALDFRMFHGPFVTRRESWTSRRLDAGVLRIMDVLERLRRDEDSHAVAAAIKLDPALPYRLLRYVNSPGAGLATKLDSIEQVLLVLGRQNLYRWLTLLLFTAAPASPRAPTLLETALVRARLMELLAPAGAAVQERDQRYLVGLFSLLDVVMETPLAHILGQLPVAEPVREALLENAGPYSQAYDLVLACEAGDEDELALKAAALGLDAEALNTLQLRALAWAQQVLV